VCFPSVSLPSAGGCFNALALSHFEDPLHSSLHRRERACKERPRPPLQDAPTL
jgi:hypothetical protein